MSAQCIEEGLTRQRQLYLLYGYFDQTLSEETLKTKALAVYFGQ